MCKIKDELNSNTSTEATSGNASNIYHFSLSVQCIEDSGMGAAETKCVLCVAVILLLVTSSSSQCRGKYNYC